MATMRLDSAMTPAATVADDANGNTLGDDSKTYSWDVENRLSSVTLPGSGGTVSFRYDPFGRRIQKSSALGTTNFLYDDGNLIEELDNAGNVLARYTHGASLDEPLAQLRSGTASYYSQDGLGSISALTDYTGAIANTYTYDSFGKLTASTGTLTNPFRYTGREHDQETGLDFYRARYLDSSIGRFLSEDPLGFNSDNGSFYRYVKNHPTFFRDPTGLLSIGPGFSPQCLADLLNAIQMLKNRPPACDCWFSSHGPHIPLFVLLDNPLYTVNYDPKGNSAPGEQNTLAYINPGDPFNIYMTPNGCNSGPTHIAQDLVHELGHLMLGHYLPWYQQLNPQQENREHDKLRLLEGTCGFAVQTQGTSITVTAQ